MRMRIAILIALLTLIGTGTAFGQQASQVKMKCGTAPANPEAGKITTYCDSNTGMAECKDSTGKSCTYKWMSCQPGLGDGLNAIPAGTYLQSSCYNDTGATVTITGIKCYTDNSGTSTMAVTNGAGTALLTGAVTCSTAFAAGTQSATVTIANGDFLKFTFVADGTSKQTTWVVTESR